MSNVNLDRFDSWVVDDNVTCVNCGSTKSYADMVYDEHLEHYYCDKGCFDEYADSNPEEVADFYYRFNCE